MAKKADNNGSFSVVYHDLGKRLGIKGNEILAYSVIDHYTKDCGACKGGFTFISSVLNCRVATAQSVINSLLDKGLIERIPTKDRVKYYYRTVKEPITKSENSPKGVIDNAIAEIVKKNDGNRNDNITETVKEEKKCDNTESVKQFYENRNSCFTENENDHNGNRNSTITETVNSDSKGDSIGNSVGKSKGNNLHSELYLNGEDDSQRNFSENFELVYDKENECYVSASKDDLSWLGGE